MSGDERIRTQTLPLRGPSVEQLDRVAAADYAARR
jgi:hypothetical protein